MTYFEYLLGNTPDGAKRAFGVILTLENDEKVLKTFSDYEKAKSYCDFAYDSAAEKDGVYTVELKTSLKRKTESKKQGLRPSSNTDEGQIRVNLIKK